MENQHRKIKGYRELTQEEIDLMNKIKEVGLQLQTLCDTIDSYHEERYRNIDISNDEFDRINKADPFCWANEGRRKLQEGLMCLTRSVAQPTFLS